MTAGTREQNLVRLAAALGQIAASAQGREYLRGERRTAETLRADPEWLWWALVRSFSTMGGSRPYEKVKGRRCRLRFELLACIPAGAQRAAEIRAIVKGTGMRFHRYGLSP